MPPAPRQRNATLILSAALVLILVGSWQWMRPRNAAQKPPLEQAVSEGPSQPRKIAGFVDQSRESGIDFHMNFLPTEQGETFKLNLYDHGAGLAIADFDADGDDDVFFCNQLGPNALYANQGDGTFQQVDMGQSGTAIADRVCVGAAAGDYDNDGDQDLFVTTTRGGNVLLENRGQGRFQDVSKKAGVDLVAHSQTAAFFDYDNDADLDLFVTNTAHWTTSEDGPGEPEYPGKTDIWEVIESPKEFNVLYRNNADGTFKDVTRQAGLRGHGWGGDVAVFDYDDDGFIDLFVTNMFGRSQLYRNLGNGRFGEVTARTLQRTSYGAIGCKAFDVENDGRLDLLVADMHSDMWLNWQLDRGVVEPSKKYSYVTGRNSQWDPAALAGERESSQRLGIRYEQVVFGNTLFRNDGRGKFTERSDAAGLETFWPWGIATGDFDNNGFEDVFLPSGMGYPFFYYPSALMMNRGDGTFVDRASQEGIEPPTDGIYLDETIGGQPAPRSSRCAACADFDGDGRLDLLVNNFNDRPYYFRNKFKPRNYLAFKLHGTRSNRDAIGATVRLFVGDQVLVRQVSAAGGYLSQSSKTLHFGLGNRTKIDRLEIRWPSGQRQSPDPPALNALHEFIEPPATGKS